MWGCLYVWARSDLTLLFRQDKAHAGPISTLAFDKYEHMPMLMSGGADGIVKVRSLHCVHDIFLNFNRALCSIFYLLIPAQRDGVLGMETVGQAKQQWALQLFISEGTAWAQGMHRGVAS